MYDLITRLAERKANTKFLRIERKPFKITFLDEMSQEIDEKREDEKREVSDMQKEAITDLIRYLIRLKFLNLSRGEDKYEITGVLEDVPSKIKTLTKEENDFLKQYKRLQYFMIVYTNLYNKYSGREIR